MDLAATLKRALNASGSRVGALAPGLTERRVRRGVVTSVFAEFRLNGVPVTEEFVVGVVPAVAAANLAGTCEPPVPEPGVDQLPGPIRSAETRCCARRTG